jgi:hypothetical protein
MVSAVDRFVGNCAETCLEDVSKQDIINLMGWLRKQPLAIRKRGIPTAPACNVAIFLRELL